MFGSPADQSRKFSKQRKSRPLPASVCSRTCAEHGDHVTSILDSPICGCLHARHWTSGHPRHVFEAERKLAVAVYLPRQSVPELSGFWCFIWPRNIFIPISTCQVWQDGGVTWSLFFSRSPTEIPRVLAFSLTIINVASSVVWMMGWRYAHAISGSRRIGKCMTGPWSSSRNARRWLPQRGRMILRTIPSKYTLLRTEPNPSRRRPTGRPGRRMTQQGRTNQPPLPIAPWCQKDSVVKCVGIVMIADTRIIIRDHQDAMGRLGLSQPHVTRPGGTRSVNGHGRRLHRAVPAQIQAQCWFHGPSGISTCLVEGDGIPALSIVIQGYGWSQIPALSVIQGYGWSQIPALSVIKGYSCYGWWQIPALSTSFQTAWWRFNGPSGISTCVKGCRLGKGCRLSKSCRLGKGGRPGRDCQLGKDCRLSRGCCSRSSSQHSRLA